MEMLTWKKMVQLNGASQYANTSYQAKLNTAPKTPPNIPPQTTSHPK
jgi:hypothetical protein